MEWYSKQDGILIEDGKLYQIRKTSIKEEFDRFIQGVWGKIKNPRDRKIILKRELRDTLDEFDKTSDLFIETYSNVRNQRRLCLQLYRDHVNLESALEEIDFLNGVSIDLYLDLAKKLKMTFEFRDKKLKNES